MAKILIVGCGALGAELGMQLQGQGHTVIALKRSALQPPYQSLGCFQADIAKVESLHMLAVDFDFVFFIVAPAIREIDLYRDIYELGLGNLLRHFDVAPNQPHWFMVSSTSVYDQNRGEWIDETTSARSKNDFSRYISEAEQRLWRHNAQHIVVRFSGIYGAGRNYLFNKVLNGAAFQQNPPYYTNRIHQQDCVDALIFLLRQTMKGRELQSLYLLSDDLPVPIWEVVCWLAEQMQLAQPQALTESTVSMNKRCNNDRVKTLGYRFHYPSYREGYREW